MAKTKTVWVCSSCGNDFPKWEGRCSACGAWNTLVEEKVTISSQTRAKSGMTSRQRPRPLRVSEIETSDAPRIRMPSKELNRVLGGGLVPGSMVLIGGEPGIGKSTLVLQNTLSIQSRRVLYVSGEESAMQIKMRAERLGRQSDTVYIVCDTSLENIFEHIENTDPGLIVIDSIQTIASDELESPAGSVGQVRECSARLLRYAKESGVPVIVIGHITKEGNIAGPKVLEHIVDTVLQFEGDRHYLYRLLRSIKNRFGSTSELGIYEMVRSGLREVTNPSEMIEVQALVSTAAYGTPQRSVTGFDAKRMNMLLAVLEKRVGFKLAQKDVFLNIAGGMKVNDPALDMAVISAILSSNVDIVVPHTVCMAGEVGLTGEIRPVTRIEQRIQEAEKLGMEQIIIPRSNVKGMDLGSLNIKITEVSKVEEAFRLLFA